LETGVADWWWLPIGRVPEIEAAELHSELDRDPSPQVIDVRTPGEFAAGHIRGAISVPITELKAKLSALEIDPDRPVFAICATSHRSIPAVRLLRRSGFEAKQLKGGMITWHRAHLPVVKGTA
jgi:rhodanese-related sulfurtransferase